MIGNYGNLNQLDEQILKFFQFHESELEFGVIFWQIGPCER